MSISVTAEIVTLSRTKAFTEAAEMVRTLRVKQDDLGLVENALTVIEAALRWMSEHPHDDVQAALTALPA